MSKSEDAGWRKMDTAVLVFGMTVLGLCLYPDWIFLLEAIGFPTQRLQSPRVQGEIVIVRVLGVVLATLMMCSRLILLKYPISGRIVVEKIHEFRLIASRNWLFIPLFMTTLILVKTVLQFVLYFIGYQVYAADDFGRALKADHWLYHKKFDLGWNGWLGLEQSGWLPFSDYLFGLALAIERDIFLTPKIVNMVVSGIAVVALYFLGRELFGRRVGFITATLFAFQPWNVWLGISGMTSDLPTIVLIALFGMCLFRWLETNRPSVLLAASGCLFMANGFRYENWLFSMVFSLLIGLNVISGWRRGPASIKFQIVPILALAIVNVLPVAWMIASYFVLGDWLPALNQTNVSYVSTDSTRAKINIILLAVTSFPLEILVSIAGIAMCLRSERRKSVLIYLLVLVATFVVFAVVVKGRLPLTGAGVSRNLLPFIVILLPFAGYLVVKLLEAPELGRNQSVFVGFLILLTFGIFDIMRAFNYPASYPRDALAAGWTLRSLQETGTIRENGMILIERDSDWGDLSLVALGNKPERFVVLSMPRKLDAAQPPPGAVGLTNPCEQGFQTKACKRILVDNKFHLAILSSPDRVRSFQNTFNTRAWIIGKYHIFELE